MELQTDPATPVTDSLFWRDALGSGAAASVREAPRRCGAPRMYSSNVWATNLVPTKLAPLQSLAHCGAARSRSPQSSSSPSLSLAASKLSFLLILLSGEAPAVRPEATQRPVSPFLSISTHKMHNGRNGSSFNTIAASRLQTDRAGRRRSKEEYCVLPQTFRHHCVILSTLLASDRSGRAVARNRY